MELARNNPVMYQLGRAHQAGTLPAHVVTNTQWAAAVHAQGLMAQGLGHSAIHGALPQTFINISPSDAARAYHTGLAQGGVRIDGRRDSSASRQELAGIAELTAWLAHLPREWGRDVYTVVPEDLVAYMESHWVVRHGRTYVGDNPDPVASASGAKGHLLNVEHYFNALGRVGKWDPTTLRGNPCRSHLVVSWRRGYKRNQWLAGVRPVAATPVTRAHVPLLTQTGDAPANQRPTGSVQHATRIRDDALIYYLHEAGQRAGEVSSQFRRPPHLPAS